MFIESHHLVYPEGDTIEIEHPLNFNDLVDLNGQAIRLPLPSPKFIVYRVYKMRREEERGENRHFYHLELLKGEELFRLVRRPGDG
ncbi:MAG TPA: hypothetical protein ENN41_08065 [Sediminispirochaeta sp.]|nr:hypothetical protein [Sediminispirochaeta sp.]